MWHVGHTICTTALKDAKGITAVFYEFSKVDCLILKLQSYTLKSGFKEYFRRSGSEH
jgi:hypothetical protein